MEEELLTFFPNGIRALLVDDNTPFVNSARTMLNLLHFKVATCKTPTAALQFLSKNQKDIIDVVLVDGHKASTCGFDLRAIVERDLHIPVVYYMSLEDPIHTAGDGTLSRMVQAATYIINKPLDASELGSLWRVIAYRRLAWDARKVNGHNGHCKGKHASPSLVGDKGRSLSSFPPGSYVDDEDEDNEIESRAHFKVVRVHTESKKQTHDPRGEGSSKTHKHHIVWSPLLKERFKCAVEEMGIGHPSKILEHMNVKGLKRHHVASHLQKYRAKLQMKNDMCNTSNCCRSSGDRPPQATHIVQTAHQPQISSVDRGLNISAMPFANGTDAPVPTSWPSSSQEQAVKDVFGDIAPMDMLTKGPPSSSYNPNTFPQVFFGPFSYQGPSLQASDTPPANYAGDHVTAASQYRTGSLVPESFDAEIEAFFGSTEPTMEASENGAAAGAGTFVPPDQADAVASAEEDIAMVAEMMAAPSDVHLAMASYEATALNTDDQFLFPLEALRGLDVPMDINNYRVTDNGAITWLNGEADVQDYAFF
ncbi:hypothetical protein CFC21_089816 [Triticum aestivum]|uniref:Two-component response regulator n=3 Tax=Triticum TaxID=4564 RepID=A0A9R1BF20_TRITD|nr:hypothetical protein CFC21_089816 [Triticum aestivum]VAI62267.1 unnamed protein product [Triticum turgidum subsp. durum]